MHASDMDYYVTKYPFHKNDFKLINEYLAYQFALQWDLEIPTHHFITLKREHLPEDLLGSQLSYLSISNILLGSRIVPDTTDLVDNFNNQLSTTEIRLFDKTAFLKIALFDLWLCNEDRNTNNLNILMKKSAKNFTPIMIDHEKIFNSGNPITTRLISLTYEDSLFYSHLFQRLFINRQDATVGLFLEVASSLDSLCSLISSNLEAIVAGVPEEWDFQKSLLKESLMDQLLTPEWLKEVKSTFLQYASLLTQK